MDFEEEDKGYVWAGLSQNNSRIKKEKIISKAPIILNSSPVLACMFWELGQVNLFSGPSILKRAPTSALEKRKR